MAEVVEDPEALEAWEASTFRFSTETLNRWFDGQVWILTAGIDYPIRWPWQTLKVRLRQNASARFGRLRIGRLDETRTQIQFFAQ